MKKEYKDLELETVTFEDVITASGAGCLRDEEICTAPAYGEDCECNGGYGEPCQDTAKYLKR